MKKLALAGVAAFIAAAAAIWWTGIVSWERHTGYFGPAFSLDGKHLYAVVRETNGFTWGLGWEHFTPPARAYPIADSVRLVRIDITSGQEETLEAWHDTPVLRRVISEYRGRVFNSLRAAVKPDRTGAVRYEVELAIPVVPASEVHRVSGTWSAHNAERRRGTWQREPYASPMLSEPVVSGETEVLPLSGPESYPCALILLDHRTMTARVIVRTRAYADRYPEGPPLAALVERSRKKDIDRVAALERKHAELVARYRAEGATEIEALLKTGRALEDLGYLPKSPRLIAHRVESGQATRNGLPLFEIAEAEMASGIFPDIEKALAAPGSEVERSLGKYVVHNDYTTSRGLNAHLATGAREFLVRFRGATYRMEIRHAR
ncbi:MAG TPA: hypothetical protein VFY80_08215 [Burkholderiales bacterium]|nr:hypothetical protein [Burkholderiales bacterium]